MSNLIMLTQRMSLGFGVSVVIAALVPHLQRLGFQVHIACLQADNDFKALNIHHLPADAARIRAYIQKHHIDCVIAHSSPYFEILPQLKDLARIWAWEHGDPTPSLFTNPHEQAERQKIIRHKQNIIYPQLDQIIAISHFIKQELQIPQATVIWNGADHLPSQKPHFNADQPLKIGALMRLGSGEAFYKGNALYIQLAQALAGKNYQFYLMGRGSTKDARPFEAAGIQVHLNGSEAEKINYLKQLDIFVSLSLWEGFNLPLVEAQRLGCLAIALDTGAHPEVTPFIVSDLAEMIGLIQGLQAKRHLLHRYQQSSQHWVNQRFQWVQAAQKMAALYN